VKINSKNDRAFHRANLPSQGICLLGQGSILNKRRVISLPYKQRALSGSIGEKLKEKMGHKLMIGSHYSYEYGKLPWPLGGLIVPLGGVMGYG
jgi:hypothetical protein